MKLREDHATFSIVSKLLEKFKHGKDIKEAMPLKTATRYIYQIYLKKSAEMRSLIEPKKPKDNKANVKSSSPDQPKGKQSMVDLIQNKPK